MARQPRLDQATAAEVPELPCGSRVPLCRIVALRAAGLVLLDQAALQVFVLCIGICAEVWFAASL